jgi:Ca-activated chloride channel family protein
MEGLYPAQPMTLRDEFKVTDGLANQGIVEPERLHKKVEGMRKSGVAVTTLGVGDYFDEDLLTALAEKSGGNYYFIDSPDNIPAIFSRELQDLLSVVAQNVQLTVECSDAVSVSKVWNYRPTGDRDLTIGLPDLVSCDRKLVVLELCRTAEAREHAIRRADEQDFGGARQIMHARIDCISRELSVAEPSMQQELAEELAFMEAAQAKFCDAAYDANSRKLMASRNYQRRSNKKP